MTLPFMDVSFKWAARKSQNKFDADDMNYKKEKGLTYSIAIRLGPSKMTISFTILPYGVSALLTA